MRTVLAADFGGTTFRVAIVDSAGALLARDAVPTPSTQAPAELLEAVLELLHRVASAAAQAPSAVCVAVPGLVDADAGKVIIASNVAGFRNLVLTVPIAERLGIPSFIENDVSAAALGELRFGAARGVRNLLHAGLGTGIGGGIVIDGRLYRGAAGLAGEIGHMILDPSGPICNCGSRGCLEAMASGVAFADRARQLAATGKSPVLVAKLAAKPVGEALTGQDLFAAAVDGDALCEAEIRHGGHLLGLALGSLVNALNPDMVTLSGGLLGMGEMLLEPLRQAMASIARGNASGALLRLTELGDSAGLLGAAAVAFERLDEEQD